MILPYFSHVSPSFLVCTNVRMSVWEGILTKLQCVHFRIERNFASNVRFTLQKVMSNELQLLHQQPHKEELYCSPLLCEAHKQFIPINWPFSADISFYPLKCASAACEIYGRREE